MKHLVVIFLSEPTAEKKVSVKDHTWILHVKTLASGMIYFLKSFLKIRSLLSVSVIFLCICLSVYSKTSVKQSAGDHFSSILASQVIKELKLLLAPVPPSLVYDACPHGFNVFRRCAQVLVERIRECGRQRKHAESASFIKLFWRALPLTSHFPASRHMANPRCLVVWKAAYLKLAHS